MVVDDLNLKEEFCYPAKYSHPNLQCSGTRHSQLGNRRLRNARLSLSKDKCPRACLALTGYSAPFAWMTTQTGRTPSRADPRTKSLSFSAGDAQTPKTRPRHSDSGREPIGAEPHLARKDTPARKLLPFQLQSAITRGRDAPRIAQRRLPEIWGAESDPG